MLYIVRVYEDGQIYEYEYGLLDHARQHMQMERCRAELYIWLYGQDVFLEAVN